MFGSRLALALLKQKATHTPPLTWIPPRKRAGAGKAEASNALEVRRMGESAGAAAYRLLSSSHVNARSRLELDQLAKAEAGWGWKNWQYHEQPKS